MELRTQLWGPSTAEMAKVNFIQLFRHILTATFKVRFFLPCLMMIIIYLIIKDVHCWLL